MRILIIASLLFLNCNNLLAQKNNELLISAANIESVLSGKWNLVNIQPKDKGAVIKGFEMKGTGYGEIQKGADDGSTKVVVSKIYQLNQNSICFADGEGTRLVYKIVNMSKSYLRVTDGVYTLDFAKQ
jgi:hypothetical protein